MSGVAFWQRGSENFEVEEKMNEYSGNELHLMLEGKKPLSMFYYCKEMGDRDIIPVNDFLPYVENGVMVTEESEIPGGGDENGFVITYIFYAIRGQEWRIPAIKLALLAQQENLHSPDEGIDRIIGMLLGYSKDNIDDYVRQGISVGSYNKLRRAN